MFSYTRKPSNIRWLLFGQKAIMIFRDNRQIIREFLRKVKEYLWSAGYVVDSENRLIRLFFYLFVAITAVSMIVLFILLFQ